MSAWEFYFREKVPLSIEDGHVSIELQHTPVAKLVLQFQTAKKTIELVPFVDARTPIAGVKLTKSDRTLNVYRYMDCKWDRFDYLFHYDEECAMVAPVALDALRQFPSHVVSSSAWFWKSVLARCSAHTEDRTMVFTAFREQKDRLQIGSMVYECQYLPLSDAAREQNLADVRRIQSAFENRTHISIEKLGCTLTFGAQDNHGRRVLTVVCPLVEPQTTEIVLLRTTESHLIHESGDVPHMFAARNWIEFAAHVIQNGLNDVVFGPPSKQALIVGQQTVGVYHKSDHFTRSPIVFKTYTLQEAMFGIRCAMRS